MPSAEVCATAACAIDRVTRQGQSLAKAIQEPLAKLESTRHAETRELVWGTVRWYFRYQPLINQLLYRPLHKNDRVLEALLLCACYQYEFLSAPDFAVTSSSVDACTHLKRPSYRSLVNAVLRKHLRQGGHKRLDQNGYAATPHWLLNEFRQSWPDEWQQIATESNQRPPQTLRVNHRQLTRGAYITELCREGIPVSISPLSSSALTLHRPRPVHQIPGFSEGVVSIQDAAAQLVPWFLGPVTGQRVLDACAAPGSKACHLLESEPNMAALWAIDLPERIPLIEQNFRRLGVEAVLLAGDASQPNAWWDGERFDAILVDAPCSGAGVIRRHPDIRLHRRPEDLSASVATQIKLLSALWTLLKPGGRLLYVTCSVLEQENDRVVDSFLTNHVDAQTKKIQSAWGRSPRHGWQLLPGDGGGDGFYFARLDRRPDQQQHAITSTGL